MSPSIGDIAPDFSLFTDEKEAWTLSDQRGNNVVLLFFPAAFSGTCSTELNTVNNDLARFNDLNAIVVGISTDTPFALAEFKGANAFNFPLLSDHSATVCTNYGVKFGNNFAGMGMDRIAQRAVFVLNAEGAVVHSEVLDNPGNEPSYEAIMDALESL